MSVAIRDAPCQHAETNKTSLFGVMRSQYQGDQMPGIFPGWPGKLSSSRKLGIIFFNPALTNQCKLQAVLSNFEHIFGRILIQNEILRVQVVRRIALSHIYFSCIS